MIQNIYILSAPVQSGKTTSLMEFWESSEIGFDGFITPDIDESRKMIFLDTEEEIPLEMEPSYTGEVVRVGKYYFSKESFGLAKDKIAQFHLSTKKVIIIDEVGPLELNDLGLEPEFSEFIARFKELDNDTQLILVVRDTLLNRVIEKYDLEAAQVLSLHIFNQLFLSE